MALLEVRLFGELQVEREGVALQGIEAGKTRELLCYLLLHRNRAHSREYLANLLWSDASPAHSKKYLRQSLWQIRSALEEPGPVRLIVSDESHLSLNPEAPLQLDVAVFEAAYERSRGLPGLQLDRSQAQALRAAIALYRGDLLDDWYQDWCLFDRERLQTMYLVMLDKLMGFCEVNGEYERAVEYGNLILQSDRSREHTHRSLMRLQYMAGNRTGALRQFDRCAAALEEDLGVKPARSTVALYEQIRADDLDGVSHSPGSVRAHAPGSSDDHDTAGRLDRFEQVLADIKREFTRLREELSESAADMTGSN